MSAPLKPHYVDPKGGLVYGFDGYIVFAVGTTVPTDTSAGYSPGCIFLDTNAAANATIFVNEGTSASSDFNALPTAASTLASLNVTALSIGGTVVTATAAELNNVADADGGVATLTAAGLVLTAAESGKTYFINNATGFVAATLPAPGAGLRFTFINKTANTSGNHTIVTASSSNIIVGNQNSVAGDAGDTGATDDRINFVANSSVAGDKVELISDGTSWFAYAISKVAAGITFDTAS